MNTKLRNLTPTNRYIVLGLASFLVGVLLSISLFSDIHHFRSVSFYGTQRRTIVPFTIGLLVGGYFLLRAAISMPRIPGVTMVKYIFFGLILLIVALAATPGILGQNIEHIHVKLTVAYFLLQLLLGAWVLFMLRWDNLNVLLLGFLSLVSYLMLLFYINPGLHLLIAGEIATMLTAGAMVIRSLPSYVMPIKHREVTGESA
jgi:hypothetical protein